MCIVVNQQEERLQWLCAGGDHPYSSIAVLFWLLLAVAVVLKLKHLKPTELFLAKNLKLGFTYSFTPSSFHPRWIASQSNGWMGNRLLVSPWFQLSQRCRIYRGSVLSHGF